jgi:murein DD-endopeptidase MepM/ murein hydrolase activator NlpD
MTAVKMAFPTFAEEVSQSVEQQLNATQDVEAALNLCSDIISASDEKLTALISGGAGEPETVEAESGGSEDSAVDAKPMMARAYYAMQTRSREGYTPHYETREAEAETVEAVALSEETEETITAFLTSQEEFMYLGLPESVSFDYEELEIEYELPIQDVSSSGFGYRLHPILNVVKFHYGTDFPANQGDVISAFADGTVTFSGEMDGYGNCIVISHDGGCETLYAHCSALAVSAGEYVTLGQTIGYVGATGLATGPHLHFELKKDGTYLNPEYYIDE